MVTLLLSQIAVGCRNVSKRHRECAYNGLERIWVKFQLVQFAALGERWKCARPQDMFAFLTFG